MCVMAAARRLEEAVPVYSGLPTPVTPLPAKRALAKPEDEQPAKRRSINRRARQQPVRAL